MGVHSTRERHGIHRCPLAKERVRQMCAEASRGNGESSNFHEYGLSRYEQLVKPLVSEERYSHIVRVALLAEEIAAANSFSRADTGRVVKAALLHDAARDLTGPELMELAPPECDLERRHPLSLHGRAAKVLAERWGVTDEVVLGAVEGHVFGVALTDRVGMALYVADVSEPGRGVNRPLRDLAKQDLEAAYRQAVITKINYLRRCGKEVHPAAYKTYLLVREGMQGEGGADHTAPADAGRNGAPEESL